MEDEEEGVSDSIRFFVRVIFELGSEGSIIYRFVRCRVSSGVVRNYIFSFRYVELGCLLDVCMEMLMSKLDFYGVLFKGLDWDYMLEVFGLFMVIKIIEGIGSVLSKGNFKN